MKKFFKKTEGFTLVELIVVIAILGILAGVGTVGYSGYIKKANAAVDNQLINDVMYAGELGAISNPKTSGTVTVYHKSENKNAVVAGAATGDDAVITAWMDAVFGDGWEANLEFVSADFKGGFAIPLLSSDQYAVIRDRYGKSNLNGHEKELSETMNTLANMLGEKFLNKNGRPTSEGLADLGKHFEGGANGEEFAEFKTVYSITDSSSATEIANATAMYVASKAEGMKTAEVMAIINQNVANNDPMGALTDVSEEYGKLPAYAMMYGVMTNYAKSGYASDTFLQAFESKPDSLTDVGNLYGKMCTDAEFGKYAKSDLTSDVDGYLGALEVISEYEGSFDLADENAFNNAKTQALLSGIFGI